MRASSAPYAVDHLRTFSSGVAAIRRSANRMISRSTSIRRSVSRLLRRSDQVLEVRQRVEHLHDRCAPRRAQVARRPAGQPVVAVNHVVVQVFLVRERKHALDELRQVVEDRVLVAGSFRPGRDVDDARLFAQAAAGR